MKSTKFFLLTAIILASIGLPVIAQQNPDKYGDYDRGYQYLYDGKLDLAYLLLNQYINNPDDSLKKGKAYLYIGEMLWTTGDFYGAEESLINAIHTLNPAERSHQEWIGYSYKMLGNTSLDLKQYGEAVGFYNKAISFLKGSADMPDVINGKAIAFQKQQRYHEAVNAYDSILALQPADKKFLARIIDNRGFTKWLANKEYAALPELHAALKLRLDSNYKWGLNASYAHLSDYYAASDTDSALWYANKMLEVARENQSPDDILEAMDKLVLLSTSANAKEKWYTDLKKLKDSLQLSRDTTRKRFAMIRYDFQKSKAENLQLQQVNTRQQLWMAGLTVLALISIGSIYAWNNKRRKRIKQESEERIRNERLKTSQKVHDVVANGLYSIMNELEHRPGIDREPLMNKIEGLYEQSRNISYEEIAIADSSRYDAQVHALLTSFANEKTKVIVVGNQASFWKKISPLQKQELEMILQELMINMKKHSGAGNVAIIFKTDKNNALIQYKDDGVGLDPSYPFGNGLQSTVNRINSMKGAINFGKSEKGGVAIDISLPLEPHSICSIK